MSNPIITNLVTMGNKESSGAVPAKADQSDADSHTGAPVASSTTNIPDMLRWASIGVEPMSCGQLARLCRDSRKKWSEEEVMVSPSPSPSISFAAIVCV